MSLRKCAFVLYAPNRFCGVKSSNLSKLVAEFHSSLKTLLHNEAARLSLFEPGWMLETANDIASKEIHSLKEFVRDQRLEILGGGFHDPMLPLFPVSLQQLQLKKYCTLVEKIFLTEPAGYFNASMVWELGDVDVLAGEGFNYTLVSSAALGDALGKTTRVNGWFTTEYRGSVLHLMAATNDLSTAFATDTESFFTLLNSFPESEKGWVIPLAVPWWDQEQMSLFFEKLNSVFANEEIQTWTCSHLLEQQISEGKVHLMSAVGQDLGLPPGALSCRELLLRRPEIDFLHKSLLAVYRRAFDSLSDDKLTIVENQILSAMSPFYYSDLYGTCGMRLFAVRRSAFYEIIEAEKTVFNLSDFKSQSIEVTDYLMDGKRQIWMNNQDVSLLLANYQGGTLRSLNHRPTGVNWVNALYDDGEKPLGFYDFVLPGSCSEMNTLESVLQDRRGELNAPYDYQIQRTNQSIDVLLSAEQVTNTAEINDIFRIEKKFSLSSSKSQLKVSYRLSHLTLLDFSGFFGTAVDLGMEDTENTQTFSIDGKLYSFKDFPLLLPEVSKLEVKTRFSGAGITFQFKTPARVLISKILGSHHSAEPNLVQGVRLFFFREMKLTPQDEGLFEITCTLSKKRWLT
ncbi:MAG: DUF1926 domain-containing protein [Fibrobacter sp.]|jgi:hypothetical protein|nr:DUF1926 domain-containing protein [Fibrobacter sp.]